MLISGLGQQLSFLEIDFCILSSLFLSLSLCLTPASPSFSLLLHCLLLGSSCVVVLQQKHELGQRGARSSPRRNTEQTLGCPVLSCPRLFCPPAPSHIAAVPIPGDSLGFL